MEVTELESKSSQPKQLSQSEDHQHVPTAGKLQEVRVKGQEWQESLLTEMANFCRLKMATGSSCLMVPHISSEGVRILNCICIILPSTTLHGDGTHSVPLIITPVSPNTITLFCVAPPLKTTEI